MCVHIIANLKYWEVINGMIIVCTHIQKKTLKAAKAVKFRIYNVLFLA